MTNNRLFINISIRLVAAWLALSIVGIVFANQIVSPFLPLFATVVDKISPDYSSVMNIRAHDNANQIVLIANVIHPIRLSSEKYIPPGVALTAGSDVIHTIVPMVILYTILFAWPVKQFKQRLMLLLLGFPMLLLVLALTTPQLMAGRIAMQVFNLTLKAGVVPKEPFVIKWMIFVESGGRWLLPLAAAMMCVMLMKRLSQWLTEFSAAAVPSETASAEIKTKKDKKQLKKDKRNRRRSATEKNLSNPAQSELKAGNS